MPFSIIFGAVAVPGAAYWAEAQGGLDAPFIATAVCWFVGAVLVLFIPKPVRKSGAPESKTDTADQLKDTTNESIHNERKIPISTSDQHRLSQLSNRRNTSKNYMGENH